MGEMTRRLLEVWESGMGRSVNERSILLLEGFGYSSDDRSMLDFPIGQRDEQLLELKERLFGSKIQSVSPCPHCQGSIEVNFLVSDVRGSSSQTTGGSFIHQDEEWNIQFHNPTTRDILKIEGMNVLHAAKQQLLCSCIDKAEKNGVPVTPDGIPSELIIRLEEIMEENDPYADRQIQVTCSMCQHQFSLIFDVPVFLWKDLEQYALRVLQKVHRLASAYGWSEESILNMSPTRQDLYLELVEG